MSDPAAPVYAEAVVPYALAGWPCILPVPAATKTPPPGGYTGAEGKDTDPMTLVEFATRYPHHSIALRLPLGVIGIDVDQYAKGVVQKNGAATLAEAVSRYGQLPPTWSSTARDPNGPSRIYLYRVPPQRYATKLGPDVEIIQHHHRYAVVWPSRNPQAPVDPETGEAPLYRWYDATGALVDGTVPRPEDLPELPETWVAGLLEGATDQAPPSADRASGQTLLDQLENDHRLECADVTSARLQAIELLLTSTAGSRHDALTSRTHHLIQLGASGHPGVGFALEQVREAWATLTAGEDREEELDRALLSSARKAVTVVGAHQVPRDPCLLMAGGMPLPPPRSDDPGDGETRVGDTEIQIYVPPRWASVKEVIGAHAFDPNAGLDQTLAEAVLERVYPALRNAYDSGGWLLRTPDRWELHGRLSPWAVAQVAQLMLHGDPEAPKESDAYRRAKLRARMMSNAGARAVAGMMDALVAGGMHPAAVALADLDQDPEILWAGGYPFSLRHSTEVPMIDQRTDPHQPHIHSAAVMPEKVPTPLWDAYLAAVWPDPEIRSWAIRVLSIALTGYSDKALPILIGETDRGKTQIIALMMSVLGSYAHAADPRLLSEAGERTHASIVFELKGRRLSFIDEGPRESRWAQERLKQLTGGGALTANQMGQNPVTFLPTHTTILTTNEEPPLTDPAVRSRTRLIPCDGDPAQVIAVRAAIGHVTSPSWRAEAPGVLAMLMAEAGRWLEDASTASTWAAPESIRDLAEHFGAQQDPIASWVMDETEECPEGTPARDLYQAFVASCRRSGLRADSVPSLSKWGRALTRLGIGTIKTSRSNLRTLRLRQGGGFLPGMPDLPTVTRPAPAPIVGPIVGPEVSPGPVPPPAAGPSGLDQPTAGEWRISPESGGSVEDKNTYPPQAFPQVNQPFPENSGGYGHFSVYPALTHAHTPAGSGEGSFPQILHSDTPGGPPETVADLQEQALSDTPDNPPLDPPPKKRKPQDPEKAAAAAAKRAQASAEKRATAIALAAGDQIGMPALVTRTDQPGEARAYPINLADADRLLYTITSREGGALTVDVEHTGYPIGHRDYALRTVQLGDPTFAVVLDPHQPDQAAVARWHLHKAPVLHAHSATADLIPCAHAGLITDLEGAWSRMVDTAVLAKLADPHSIGNDDDLKGLAGNVLGGHAVSKNADAARGDLFKAGKWLTKIRVTTPIEKSGWAGVDHHRSVMAVYDGSDVLDGAALAAALPRPTDHILGRERLAQRMTARIADRGLAIDGDQVNRLLEVWRPKLDEAAGRLHTFGIENAGSDAQVAARAVDLGAQLPRTPKGAPSVAKGALEQYAEAPGELGDFVRARLDYQLAETRLGLFLEPYRVLVANGDGRVRPTVYTLGADTGRMSCVRPNLQQQPREGGFRACINADPGYLLISADFASVEIRVAAALSQDPNLIQMLLEGRDLHAEIAALVWGPDGTKANRYKAKRKVFGRIYGQGLDGMARTDGAGYDVARNVITAMDALTPGLTAWSENIRDAVESGHTKFPSYAGRVIHLPEKAPHAAPNYCIQGTARELLIDALVRWSETPWAQATLLPVHDEIVAMVPEDQASEATAALVDCMTTEIAGVPIIGEASEPAFAWADSE